MGSLAGAAQGCGRFRQVSISNGWLCLFQGLVWHDDVHCQALVALSYFLLLVHQYCCLCTALAGSLFMLQQTQSPSMHAAKLRNGTKQRRQVCRSQAEWASTAPGAEDVCRRLPK